MSTQTTTEAEAREDFECRLKALLENIERAARSQFEYSLKQNIQLGITTLENAGDYALISGVASGVCASNDWCVLQGLKYSAAILEDCNAHEEAAPLFATIKLWEAA